MASKRRAPLTDEERAERRERDRERMREAVARLHTSDGWTGWLRARRRFHNYSMANLLLILQQNPDATCVAGFKTWLELGYVVQKGSTKLWLWRPAPPSKKALADWKAAGSIPDERPKTRFYMKPSVFDVSDVAPMPPPARPVPLEPPVSPIAGEDRAHLFEHLLPLVAEHGATIAVRERGLPNGADGVLNIATREILISPGLSGNGRLATAIHEVAHLLVRTLELPDERKLTYAEEEIVVESVAFTCCHTVGLDTSANSVPYVATYAEKVDLAVLEDRAALIDELARVVEAALLADAPAWTPDGLAAAAREERDDSDCVDDEALVAA